MSSLRFSGPDAVRAVLGLLPPEVAAAGGAVLQEPDGALVVTAELPAALRKTLRDAGVEELKAQPRGARRPFLHWAELVPLVPESDPDLRIVLFALPPGAPWLPLAAELVRLGCDAQEIASDGERWLIRATRPPYYTIIGTEGRLENFGDQTGTIRLWNRRTDGYTPKADREIEVTAGEGTQHRPR